jgi:regulator of sigma E protease
MCRRRFCADAKEEYPMTDIPFYIVAFILALGILIVVHEFGHFWVARRLGVKVLRFSVGFGKPLWTRRFGVDRTELVVAALPLGGYVKMLDENEGDVPRAEAHRAFNRQAVWKRALIAAAGPAFNLIFAILAYAAVYLIGIEGVQPVVGRVLPDTPAAHAGFQPGDRVVAIDGKDVQIWGQRRLYLFGQALDRETVEFEVIDSAGYRHRRVLDLTQLPAAALEPQRLERSIGLFGYFPELEPVIGGLQDGPAKQAGMQEGDRIVAVDGVAVDRWEEVVRRISSQPGRAISLTIERGGERHAVTVTPAPVTVDGKTIGRINVAPRFPEIPAEMRATLQLDPLTAITEAAADTWAMSVLTLDIFYRMLKLEVSTKNVSGPITIAQVAGQTAKIGLVPFLIFLAVVSVGLAVLNLLPVPILDGGHLLFYLIEAIKGSPLSERSMAFGQRIGILMLVGLMALAFYNDITRIFE